MRAKFALLLDELSVSNNGARPISKRRGSENQNRGRRAEPRFWGTASAIGTLVGSQLAEFPNTHKQVPNRVDALIRINYICAYCSPHVDARLMIIQLRIARLSHLKYGVSPS